jgi:ribose-phosphate pyrophosphokinase
MAELSLQFLPGAGDHAQAIAHRLSAAAAPIDVHTFPDAELRVTVAPPSSTVVIYASLHHPQDKLIAVLFASEALRRMGAKRLVLVAPYLCYMRQDQAFRPGEAVSQRVVCHLLSDAFDRVVTVDAHLHRVSKLADAFPRIEADNLSAMGPIAEALKTQGLDPATILIGPDAESEQWVKTLAERLGLSHTVAQKRRRGDATVDIALPDASAVAGRPVLLVDDIVSSGGTLKTCARALLASGAGPIEAVVTHALFDAAAVDDFKRAGIRRIRSTTSVPHSTNEFALDGLIASALMREL